MRPHSRFRSPARKIYASPICVSWSRSTLGSRSLSTIRVQRSATNVLSFYELVTMHAYAHAQSSIKVSTHSSKGGARRAYPKSENIVRSSSSIISTTSRVKTACGGQSVRTGQLRSSRRFIESANDGWPPVPMRGTLVLSSTRVGGVDGGGVDVRGGTS